MKYLHNSQNIRLYYPKWFWFLWSIPPIGVILSNIFMIIVTFNSLLFCDKYNWEPKLVKFVLESLMEGWLLALLLLFAAIHHIKTSGILDLYIELDSYKVKIRFLTLMGIKEIQGYIFKIKPFCPLFRIILFQFFPSSWICIEVISEKHYIRKRQKYLFVLFSPLKGYHLILKNARNNTKKIQGICL